MTIIGFADASPSEVISEHEAALAVACLFPLPPEGKTLSLPVKQYKDIPRSRKADKAKELATWLGQARAEGLVMPGMVNVVSQQDAAAFGLAFLEELPDTRVEEIEPEVFRLHFRHKHINLTVAVALIYYWTTARFAALRASNHVPKDSRLTVCMDRFPGASPKHRSPMLAQPKTPGNWFIDYLEEHTETGRGLRQESTSGRFSVELTSLSSWKADSLSLPVAGKKHPHFILPDWLAQSGIASSHPDAYRNAFTNGGDSAQEAMNELRTAFGEFDIWSLDRSVFQYLRPNQSLWTVPENARQLILRKAGPAKQ